MRGRSISVILLLAAALSLIVAFPCCFKQYHQSHRNQAVQLQMQRYGDAYELMAVEKHR